ncbi:uracil-xanthine permease family protein [Paramaledivibacter caminithermalis]|uniref:Uracil permease n=1 Tax=Paramaledivibacter caminithermalis (strain DSM 15212 / CIP 107654 / DViRD3) TaxID=1121301 RepID=A0A1M6LN48_PARC5|nr:solute carrier family 23 protein [Paramaledivibacter caminithermalis]SHJ72563.1 uracil permease [Paramaledivibacter caminithermalis DSM 15212]
MNNDNILSPKDIGTNIAQISLQKKIILGIQHTFTMFGATVLVPIITGFDISVALFMAGIGTLIFHLVTKGRVPAFLGSSFAFIAPIMSVLLLKTGTTTPKEAFASPLFEEGLAYAQGGLVIAGLVYLIMAGLVSIFGVEKIISFFPPIVTGPIIMVIGLKLAPTAIDMASSNWLLAIVSFSIVTAVSIYGRGFLKVLPVLIGLTGGYIVALLTGNVDFTPVMEAKNVVALPSFKMAKFSLETVMIVAPIAVATMIEHIGDVLAIGTTVNKDFVKEPGLHRTLIGDGIATSVSAMFGGPANTTYSENTGVLALTKVYDPSIVRIAAIFAIILGIMPKIGAVIKTIPTSVVGGISIVLFGMIASIGARSLVEHQIDFGKSRNLIISAVILVLGLGGAALPIPYLNVTLEGMALAAIVGIILNKVLPQDI